MPWRKVALNKINRLAQYTVEVGIQSAAVQYRNFAGQNKYNFLDFPDSKIQLTPLASYLGQSGLADGQNIFGDGSGRYPPRDIISGYVGSSWGDTERGRIGSSSTLSVIID